MKITAGRKTKCLIYGAVFLSGLLSIIYFFLPKPDLLENFTFSSAVYDKDGRLLRLTLSRDEKYRLFIPLKEIPEAAQNALLLYEDKNFYRHPGVDPAAVARAAFSTLSRGRRQGASTITMQLARLVFNIDSSTVSGKIRQMFRAVQIERHYTKKQILETYFNLAPYGDNVEGLAAAGLIYFGTLPQKLSLPEILTLIVVPQNPSVRNPARNGRELADARMRLGNLWRETYPQDSRNAHLSLPVAVKGRNDLPFHAPHLTTQVLKNKSGRIFTTIDLNLQNQIEEITASYIKRNRHKGFYNAAVLIADYHTMETVVYIGSADFWNDKISGQVNGVTAPRSPGSAMKPFIYALALEQGLIHPGTLLKDLPRSFVAYNPENFGQNYHGVATAADALVNSLNIPAVDLLQRLKPGSFYGFLKTTGVKNLRSEKHYGLAMALGGYEISMKEMVKAYAVLARGGQMRALKEIKTEQTPPARQVLSPESSFLTLDMLAKNTPVDGNEKYSLSWKTGTSYSYKDAWTAGIAGKYALAVWIGNFDGTSNHAFVGRTAAAPLFFEIVRTLEKQSDFSKYGLSPEGMNLARVDICASTGDIANDFCPKSVKGWFIPGVSPIKLSDVHRRIPIDLKSGLRACRHTPPSTRLEVFEFWPSDILAAFEKGGISKKPPPDFMEDCTRNFPITGHPPEIVYPVKDMIYMVRSHKMDEEKLVLQASADSDAAHLYWFSDDAFLAQSRPGEAVTVMPQTGTHRLKVIDDKGRTTTQELIIRMEI